MQIINGTVFCDDGVFRRMDVALNGGRISALGDSLPAAGGSVIDAEGCFVLPGFFDIHIHGAAGADFSDGTPEAIRTISQFLLTRGVTSFLGTSMALPADRLSEIFCAARPMIGRPIPDGAVLRGINMEGPFFNREKRGAQNPEYIVPPDVAMFRRLFVDSGNQIRSVAVAPETEGGLDFVAAASRLCNVSIAHTCADYAVAKAAFLCGANHVTHVFNGMPAFHHRDPGVVGAAVESSAYIELICDGIHVHPAMVQSVFKLFGDDRVCLISDAMRACGMPDGRYDLGGQMVTVKGSFATIDTGSLAGSVTVLADCFRNAVRFGVPLESAVKAATINPARSVGLERQIGSITCGKEADLVLLDRQLALRQVISQGRVVGRP